MKKFLLLSVAVLLLASLILSGCSQTTTTPPAQSPAKTTTAPPPSSTTAAPPKTTTAPPVSTAAPVTTTAPQPSSTATITLRFNSKTQPSLASAVDSFNWLVSEVSKQTQGRIKITLYLSGALAGPPQAYDALINGVMDINEGAPNDSPGRFPATDICDLPWGFPSTWAGTHALNDWYFNFKPAEWSQTVVMLLDCTNPALIGTANKPVRTLADLKGLNIRSGGNIENGELTALGAVPRPVNLGEVPGALSKGVVDGILLSPEAYPAFKLFDSIKYITDIGAIAPAAPAYMAMNKDAWNKLSAQDQQILLKAVQDSGFLRAQYIDRDLQSAVTTFKSLPGKEWITLPASEITKWQAAANVATTDYIQNISSKGMPAADYTKYLQERLAYWAKQTPPPLPSIAAPASSPAK